MISNEENVARLLYGALMINRDPVIRLVDTSKASFELMESFNDPEEFTQFMLHKLEHDPNWLNNFVLGVLMYPVCEHLNNMIEQYTIDPEMN